MSRRGRAPYEGGLVIKECGAYPPCWGIDTEEDLAKVEKILIEKGYA